MFDKPCDLSQASKFEMGLWIGRQMAYGAALASVAVGFLLFLFYGAYLVGMMLPERSKQAPSPYAALVVEPATQIV